MFSRISLWLFIFGFSGSVFASPAPAAKLSDEELLETIQKQAFQYFISESHPETGLIYDQASNHGKKISYRSASVAASGFALTAYGVGVERNWIDARSAKEKTKQILHFFLDQAAQDHGFFYHFLDPKTGKRSARSELSPIDSAWFLAGALFASEYYEDAEIRELVQKIYDRMDWKWMLHNGKTLSLAWSPEEGFSKRRWDHYDESMLMNLVAMASTTHPAPSELWKSISHPVGSYKNHRMIVSPPLFTHQYSHLWIDFKNQNDGFADYFENSVQAAQAQRQFAIDHANQLSSYGLNSWGLTASNGPMGYRAYGAPPGWAQHDGTIAPTGCVSSIMFTSKESLDCARYFYENMKDSLWGDYGFSDAFNLDKKWMDDKVIAIDQGAMLLAIENDRSGFVWKMMEKSLPIQNGKKLAGFKVGTMTLPWPDPPVYQAPYVRGGIRADGYLRDWPNRSAILMGETQKESGEIDNPEDLSANVRFAWDEDYLYMAVQVKDQSQMNVRHGSTIWQDDCVELFINPESNGLEWNGPNDFQIGFRAPDRHDQVETWSWFQGGEDPSAHRDVEVGGSSYEGGYVIEAAIRWKYLKFEAEAGKTISISPAVHDADRDKSQAKINWFFRNEDEIGRFILGKVVLESDEAKHSIPSEGHSS